MKTAREFVDATNDMDDAQMVAAVETRDAEIRAEVLAIRTLRDGFAAADAIPDVPKCPNCGPLGNDFCTWKGHWTMDSGSIPHAPVIADGRQVGTLVTAQRVDLRESPPVPSRAELIELMRGSMAAQFTSVTSDLERVLDALIKAGAVRG